MLVPPRVDNTSDATSTSFRGRRSKVGTELVPADDSASYSSRRPPASSVECMGTRQVLRTRTSAGLDEPTVVEQASAHGDARSHPRAAPSTRRRPGLQRLFGVRREAVTDLPIPCDVESEQRQISTDRSADDHSHKSKEPFGYVETQPGADERATGGR